MNKTFQWNGQKFPFSAMEAETTRKFIPGLEKVTKTWDDYERNTVGIGNLLSADNIIEECKIIDEFFDDMLGEGTAEKMFQNYDIGERAMALRKLVHLRNTQIDEYNETMSKGLFV